MKSRRCCARLREMRTVVMKPLTARRIWAQRSLFCFMVLMSGAIEAGEDLPKEFAAKDGATMVLVPAGEFWMGLPEGEGLDDEQPRHKVYLDAFYIDRFEVTTERYAKFLASTGWEQ